ncbi:MAG: mannonate dehydratase [Opitutales bacterium]|nr:mannonate dehydratase [Opitutales bacterium]MDP4643135.1 mannonate dehydratase [Opitutales bacterium]MDP4777120.1 mannonate dehydratase [Opitutales bacterium]MDP4883309.1 mannonate dehydratase [Opitutales bacterium]
MKMTMRWFGADDPVQLSRIRQIAGVTGIVSALHDMPVGEVWPLEKLRTLKAEINNEGLDFEVVESIPVHEDIKLGLPTRDTYIDNYCRNIENLGKAGIRTLCYNFMPVFDWTRTNLSHSHADGSNALSFSYEELQKISDSSDLVESLPGWAEVYTPDRFKYLMDAFRHIGQDEMWANLEYFLKKVIPIAEASGVKMCIHPDDPPWPILGLPRIIIDEDALLRLTRIIDSPSNGVTLCTGSLGASVSNNLPQIIRKLGDRIHFVHMRNVAVTGPKSFHEAPHLSSMGSLDMFAVMQSLVRIGYAGPLRPDHGRMIWGESGRPGYGLFDRALGASYLQGLHEAAQKTLTFNS